MLDNLAIQFVYHAINRCIHIGVFRRSKHFCTTQMNGGFGFLIQFLYVKDHMHVGYVIKVSLQLTEFSINIITQRIGYLDVMTSQINLHSSSSLYFGLN